MRKAYMLASLAALIAATPAAAERCDSYRIPLSNKLRQFEAAQISATGQTVRPGQVRLVYEDRGWQMVWATPDNAERGVFVFRKDSGAFKYVDVWGGVLAPDEVGSGTSWAVKLPHGGVPRRLAICFEAMVMRGV